MPSDIGIGILGWRGLWQIRLRWWVAPVMIGAAGLGRASGFDIALRPVLTIAAAVVGYNVVLLAVSRTCAARMEAQPRVGRLLTAAGMTADYAAVLALLHFTGGVSSPLLVLLIFHVIIAAIQFTPEFAHTIAAGAAVGLWLLLLGHLSGVLTSIPVTFRGQPVHSLDRPALLVAGLLSVTATLFVTAAMVGLIMRRYRGRVGQLAVTSAELRVANDKLRSLYTMLCAIGTERRLEPTLQTVVSELADVMDVPAVSVKLLSDDGTTLRYVAAHGFPEDIVRNTVLRLDSSPLNRRAVEGETVVVDRIGKGTTFQLAERFASFGIEAALLTPLRIEERVIGTLGLYAPSVDSFRGDAEFLQLAAQLAAIAIEDARANEAVDELGRERTRFMLETAHNLRAPLGAGIGLLDLLRDGCMGPLADKQLDAVCRVEARLRALHEMVGELLTIAKVRDWSREITDVVVDLRQLAERIRATFAGEAEKKGIRFRILADDDVPEIDSGADLLDQIMENLVSNAIKYTPAGGSVTVRFARHSEDTIRITVSDDGIGIPSGEQHKLFVEFFRASNAKKATPVGTGLGLAFVKQSVDRHRGTIHVASDVDEGTTFVIDLPIRQVKAEAMPATASP